MPISRSVAAGTVEAMVMDGWVAGGGVGLLQLENATANDRKKCRNPNPRMNDECRNPNDEAN
jgi:hypothetical protein